MFTKVKEIHHIHLNTFCGNKYMVIVWIGESIGERGIKN